MFPVFIKKIFNFFESCARPQRGKPPSRHDQGYEQRTDRKTSDPENATTLQCQKLKKNSFNFSRCMGTIFQRGWSRSRIKFYHVTWYIDFHKRHMQVLTSASNFMGAADPLTRHSRANELYGYKVRGFGSGTKCQQCTQWRVAENSISKI